MIDLMVAIWNEVPDAVRYVMADTPLIYGLKLMAYLYGGVLFEDMSIGS